jgi:hypothetical protein
LAGEHPRKGRGPASGQVRWPQAQAGAELVFKQHFALFSDKGPTIAIPTLIIVGNRKGFDFLSQLFAYAARRRLYSSPGDPDDHLHWGRAEAPINPRLSDDMEFRIGTYEARARKETLRKYGMTRSERGRGDAAPRYRALIKKIEHWMAMERRAAAKGRARRRSGAVGRFDESPRVRAALRAFLKKGEAPERRLAATTAQEESRLLGALWSLPFGDRGIERFSLDGVRRFLVHLARSDVPYLKAGALFGLESADGALESLDEFRKCAPDPDWRVRRAAAFGFRASPYVRDERILWSLFEDTRLLVRETAAEALTAMPRPISEVRFRAALREMRGRPALVLAERARTDRRLFSYTRSMLRQRWPELRRKRWTQGSFDRYPEAFGFSEGAGAPGGSERSEKRSRAR